MKKTGLTKKQGNEICEIVGQMLVTELGSLTVKGKADKLVADYVKNNKVDITPDELSKKLRWSVKVQLT
jgi:hypothetical protein